MNVIHFLVPNSKRITQARARKTAKVAAIHLVYIARQITTNKYATSIDKGLQAGAERSRHHIERGYYQYFIIGKL